MDINWLLENPYIISTFDCYVETYVWLMNQPVVKWFRSYNFAKCIEPAEKEWSSVCSLLYNTKNTYDICYTYDNYPVDIISEYGRFYGNRENKYGFYVGIRDEKRKEIEVKEHLYLAKQNDHYFIRTYFQGHIPFETKTKTSSKVEFVYIEYNHPKMANALELNIPRGICMVGNELFTPAFILRLLQHQGDYYYFDMNYILKIVDSSIVEITLESNQYIVMKSDEYIIQTI